MTDIKSLIERLPQMLRDAFHEGRDMADKPFSPGNTHWDQSKTRRSIDALQSISGEADGVNRQWVVERHDEDDGSISWEIWDHNPATYRRITSFNDAPDQEGRHAKADAELIVRLAKGERK